MKDLIFIIIAAGCGIAVFTLILKRYGSDCIP
jgi:hypothetical protein